MRTTVCQIGNASSGIREGAFIGTPVVNIGSRQQGRDRGNNVIDAPVDQETIYNAISKQVHHGSYPMDAIYGDGTASKKIPMILSSTKIEQQKRITY